ncbi:hypothetical protein [Ruegeria sp. HKCCE4148]|uniref:hypothetical protein n=1 Tax=Ruegeria sp. HKCCE4148 TaxID=2794829 RepID=UPI001AEAEBF1|nr:hypothetical protein [Ruegeria sp. HKCCE4148]
MLFNLIFSLPVLTPPLAFLWMAYRDIRYSDWTNFGLALGLIASIPVAGALWVASLTAKMGGGEWVLIWACSVLAEVAFSAMGLCLETMVRKRNSRT